MYNNNTMQKKQVQLRNYQILHVIGEGSSGTVRLASRKSNGRCSCVKVMAKDHILREKQVDHVHNEYRILQSLTHPFIVSFMGMSQTHKYIYFFMEFVQGGEFFRFLKERPPLQALKASFYAAQIVLLIEHLHIKHIVYRDLKPQNLLMAADGYLKLTDFGFAKKVSNRTWTLCGTPEYMAPEVLLRHGHGKAVDWWGLGVLLYEMMVGTDPFGDEDPLLTYENIVNCNLVFPNEIDKEAEDLIRKLLTSDLSKRYGNLKNGADDVKNHPFFKLTNFRTLLQKQTVPPYRPPQLRYNDTRLFEEVNRMLGKGEDVKPEDDPFWNW